MSEIRTANDSPPLTYRVVRVGFPFPFKYISHGGSGDVGLGSVLTSRYSLTRLAFLQLKALYDGSSSSSWFVRAFSQAHGMDHLTECSSSFHVSCSTLVRPSHFPSLEGVHLRGQQTQELSAQEEVGVVDELGAGPLPCSTSSTLLQRSGQR